MSRDIRRYAQQTQFRLIAGGLLILFLIGDGLIYVIYGPYAALMGFICLVGGLAPILAIVLILGLFEWIVKRADRE